MSAEIGNVFQSVLNRGPRPDEENYYDNQLAFGRSLADIRNELATSPEAQVDIDSLYQQVLGRGADSAGMTGYEAGLAQGASQWDVRDSLATSSEAAADIRAAFHNELGREATDPDVTYWETQISQSVISLGGVRWNFGHSSEATSAITSFTQQLLGRDATGDEITFWENSYLPQGTSLAQIRVYIATSPSAAAAVDSLYQQVLGRSASAPEIASWQQNALALGATLDQVRYALATSPEAANDIATVFANEWNQAADSNDLNFWEAQLNQGTSLGAMRLAFSQSQQAVDQITSIYSQVFGRAVAPWELGVQQNALVNGQTLAGMRHDLASNVEAAAAVNGLYQQVLGRSASAPESAFWQQNALALGATLDQVRYALAHTDEATGKVSWLFTNELGRAATVGDGGDISYWEGQLALTTSLAAIRLGFSLTTDAVAQINAIYLKMLGYGSDDPALLSAYQNNMGSTASQWSLSNVRADLAHRSDAAAAITTLYFTLLGRAPTPDEIAGQESSFAQGASLDAVRLSIAHSAEAQVDFDAAYYLAQNPDVAAAGADPYLHYITYGWKEGRNPSALFNTSYYLQQNPDVAAAGVDPLLHYRISGWHEGRDPSVQFNTRAYLAANPDVAAAGVDPLAHYMANGRAEGRAIVAATPDSTLISQSIAVNAFYFEVFARAAMPQETGTIELAVRAGQSLDSVLATLRAQFATSIDETAIINAFYWTNFGRLANPDEIGNIERAIAAGQTLLTIEQTLAPNAVPVSNPTIDAINAFYQGMFGRQALNPEINSFFAALSSGQTIAGIEAFLRPIFVASDFVTPPINAFYQQLFGRDALPNEVATFRGALNAGQTLQQIEKYLETAIVTNLYEQVLDRNPISAEVQVYEDNAFAQGASVAQVRVAIATSTEAARDIKGLFTAELGRTATPDDVEYWKGQLSQTASLAGIRTSFAGTKEAVANIRALYEQVLGRAATGPEVAARQSDLRQGSSLDDVRWYLAGTDEAAVDVQALYVEVLGRLGSDPEIIAQQGQLAGRTSLADLRVSFGKSPEAAGDITAIYHALLNRLPSPDELKGYQVALGSGQGWTLEKVAPAVVDTAIDQFYLSVFARTALAPEMDTIKAALIAGQSLPYQFAALRQAFSTSPDEAAIINSFYQDTFGRAATVGDGSEVGNIEGAIAAGQSLVDLESALTPEITKEIQALYRQDLGRKAAWPELSGYIGLALNGTPVSDIRADIAYSPESAARIQALFQKDFGRAASGSEVAGWQMAEASGANAAGLFTVGANVGTLATADARTVVVEAATYVTLNGGLAPTVTGSDGQVVTFRNATEFAAYALAMAYNSGQANVSLLRTYNLALTWMDQVGQVDIQAASALQALSTANFAAGQSLQGYAEGLGAQLAMKIQQTPPASRQPVTLQVMAGQWQVTVTVTGDANDARGLAGFGYTLVDTDPGRTQLLQQAQAEADLAQTGDAGNQFLVMLDNEQARIDVALANLPANARSDRMLSVAQQFVDAGRQAAANGNWNLVQTLETAADVSLQIAAMPEGSRVKLTERFMHESVKHDITVDPNTADPFASFTDHSKGQDVIGGIIEAVVGVVINILAVFPPTSAVFIPIAIAWDVAEAGKNFAEGNILGGILSLASAVGVGLSGLQALSAANGAVSTSADLLRVADSVAGSLGVSATPAVIATATTAGAPAISAATNLGHLVLAGVGVVGGAAGIAQSAERGDALGIAAGVLEIAAAAASGLISANSVPSGSLDLVQKIGIYSGVASVGLSASDAFIHGDLAGGLASSLNALTSLIGILNQNSGSNGQNGAGTGQAPATDNQGSPIDPTYRDSAHLPVTQEDLPPIDGYGDDGKPLPIPPIPPRPTAPPSLDTGTAGGRLDTLISNTGDPGSIYAETVSVASAAGDTLVINPPGQGFGGSALITRILPRFLAGPVGALLTLSELLSLTPQAIPTFSLEGAPDLIGIRHGDLISIYDGSATGDEFRSIAVFHIHSDGTLTDGFFSFTGSTVGKLDSDGIVRLNSGTNDLLLGQLIVMHNSGVVNPTSGTVNSSTADSFGGTDSPGERSADIDADIDEIAKRTKDRVVAGNNDAGLDDGHLADAEGEQKGIYPKDSNGNDIINPKTGKPFDHVNEVQENIDGVNKDIKKLTDRLEHHTDFGNPTPTGSIEDGLKLLEKLYNLVAKARASVPVGKTILYVPPYV